MRWSSLYARAHIPPEVPGTSSRAEEPSAVTACEVFGEALERFAREQFLSRGTGRSWEALGKSPFLFPRLGPESENWSALGREN